MLLLILWTENLHYEKDIDNIDLTVLDPVIYSDRYHSLGKMLGKIGDFILSNKCTKAGKVL